MYMNKYAKYIKELKNFEMYEDQMGFITYGPLRDGLYIEDIYVEPEFRKLGLASYYADIVTEIAKREGIKKLYGSVSREYKNYKYRIAVLEGYGFKEFEKINDAIWFIKEIE